MVIVIARFRPRPDRRDDLVALLEEVQAASRRDDGFLHYGYYTEITDPLSFIAVEEWRDNEALAAHLRQPHVARLIAALPELGDDGSRSPHTKWRPAGRCRCRGRPAFFSRRLPASRQKASTRVVELLRDLLEGLVCLPGP